MRIANILFTLALCAVAASCVNSTSVLPNVTGKANEVLLIMDDPYWTGQTGDSVYNYFSQDIPGIPWEEPYFDVSRVDHDGFLNILLTARNVVDVDISKIYTKPQVKFFKDLYSESQTYVKIQSPNGEGVLEALGAEGDKILSFFYAAERKRTLDQYRRYNNTKTVQQIFDTTGVEMMIPTSYNRVKFGKDFVWLMAGKSKSVQQNILIYWYEYNNEKDFEVENLVSKRDSILKVNIPGPSEGSYMRTGTFYPPILREFNVNKNYVAELRGIWDIEGDMMGGPFISHNKVDERRRRIVTIEGFVYAPNIDKRNYLRQIEAMIFTARFPDKLAAKKGDLDAEE